MFASKTAFCRRFANPTAVAPSGLLTLITAPSSSSKVICRPEASSSSRSAVKVARSGNSVISTSYPLTGEATVLEDALRKTSSSFPPIPVAPWLPSSRVLFPKLVKRETRSIPSIALRI